MAGERFVFVAEAPSAGLGLSAGRTGLYCCHGLRGRAWAEHLCHRERLPVVNKRDRFLLCTAVLDVFHLTLIIAVERRRASSAWASRPTDSFILRSALLYAGRGLLLRTHAPVSGWWRYSAPIEASAGLRQVAHVVARLRPKPAPKRRKHFFLLMVLLYSMEEGASRVRGRLY